jgi:hypothetical protein
MKEMDDMTDFEDQVESLAAQFRYPPTPDVQLGQAKQKGRIPRLAWALAVLIAVAFAVPPVRAAVGEILRVGAVRIIQGGQSEIPGDAATILDLPGQTTLKAAQREVGFEIRMPAELDPPDRVWLLDLGEPSVALVWLEEDDTEVPEIVLYAIPSSSVATKLMPQTLENAMVDGQPATWVTGDHTLELLVDNQAEQIYVRGNVLLWTAGALTYRMETALTLPEAVRLAESMD